MQRVVIILVGLAAAIYIGQFAWGFKERADQREAARIERAEAIIRREVRRAAEGG